MICYIYIATPIEWNKNKNKHSNGFKIGYTTNPTRRNYDLRHTDGYTIRLTYVMDLNNRYDGELVEKVAQRLYRTDFNVEQVGNDYFKANKVITNKAIKCFPEIVQRAHHRAMG